MGSDKLINKKFEVIDDWEVLTGKGLTGDAYRDFFDGMYRPISLCLFPLKHNILMRAIFSDEIYKEDD